VKEVGEINNRITFRGGNAQNGLMTQANFNESSQKAGEEATPEPSVL
jgi:hypothetical protein